MNIEHIKELSRKPHLYEKGTSVMWTDPYISKQLLELHLNPNLDIASREKCKIEHITNWILSQTSENHKLDILDLGCGPGLYAELLAKKGHAVTGVDFSLNSIQYAERRAKENQLNINYLHKNYLEIDFVNQFDLIILIFLDFCVLLPNERDIVLKNIYRALKKDGIFICDVINDKNIEKKILTPSWEIQKTGFWKDAPYIALSKGHHYPESKVFANHHIIIGDNDDIKTYIFWNHYYNSQDLSDLFLSKGLTDIKHFENILPDSNDAWNGENVSFYLSRKK